MARKSHAPTDETRLAVRTRAGLGVPQDAIARYLRIDEKTLRKHYDDELQRGIDEANTQVAGAIFNAATGRFVQDDGSIKRIEPNITAGIWWSKTRMGWREPPRDLPTDVAPLTVNGPNATIIVTGGLPEVAEQHDLNGSGDAATG